MPIEHTEKEIESLRNRTNKAERELLLAQNRLSALERSSARQIEDTLRSRDEARDEIEDLKRDLREMESIDDLKKTLAIMKTDLMNTQTELEGVRTTKTESLEQNRKLEAQVLEKTLEIEQGQSQVHQLRNDIVDFEKRLASSSAALFDAEIDSKELQDQISQMNFKISDLQTEVTSTEMVKQASAKFERRALDTEKLLSIAEEAAEAMRAERDLLLRRAAEAEAKDRETSGIIQSLNSNISALENSIRVADLRREQVEEELDVGLIVYSVFRLNIEINLDLFTGNRSSRRKDKVSSARHCFQGRFIG